MQTLEEYIKEIHYLCRTYGFDVEHARELLKINVLTRIADTLELIEAHLDNLEKS